MSTKENNTKSDITIIFLTANRVPKKWAQFHKEKLIEAAGNSPIITVSMEPLDWGTNILQDAQHYGIANIWGQLLRAAKIATTDYIGVAEDDALYPKEHFEYRPPPDSFAYNKNRFGLFTWGRPTYFWRDRMGNFAMIAPRKLLIEALEERLQKNPPHGARDGFTGELGRPEVEDKLGVKRRKAIQFLTGTSIIIFDHRYGTDVLSRRRKKKMGTLRAYDIPHWGRAEDLVKKFA